MLDPGSKWRSPFSPEEYSQRISRTASALLEARIDALIAFANKVMPGHVRYLSGYETRHGIHDWSMFLLDPGSCASALLTNVSWEEIADVSWVRDVRFTSLDRAPAVLRDWLPLSARRIGVAGFNAFPAPLFRAVQDRGEIVDASGITLEVRQVKSPAEIDVLRRAAAITDAGANAFLAAARPGRSEREILVEVESALKLAGSDEVSFTTQVGSGPRTAAICPYPTDRRVQPGDVIQVDCGASYFGYRGDISRVLPAGSIRPELRKMLDVTAQMYEAMLGAVRPGADVACIAAIGMEVARNHGLGDCLYRSPNHDVGFMGHGMGCSYHEPPELNPETHTVLSENMLIVLEPILMRPGVGGVKLEDAVLVAAGGAERLSSCPLRNW